MASFIADKIVMDGLTFDDSVTQVGRVENPLLSEYPAERSFCNGSYGYRDGVADGDCYCP